MSDVEKLAAWMYETIGQSLTGSKRKSILWRALPDDLRAHWLYLAEQTIKRGLKHGL